MSEGEMAYILLLILFVICVMCGVTYGVTYDFAATQVKKSATRAFQLLALVQQAYDDVYILGSESTVGFRPVDPDDDKPIAFTLPGLLIEVLWDKEALRISTAQGKPSSIELSLNVVDEGTPDYLNIRNFIDANRAVS